MKRSEVENDWWRQFPDLYQAEIDAFDRHGAKVAEIAKRSGTLILEVWWPLPDREPVRLKVGFSPLHPFARPAVSAPDLSLNRHQNPFNSNLCLLTQESGQWDPSTTIADHIGQQLPEVLNVISLREAGRWDEAAQLEEQAPDGITRYYQGESERFSAIFFSHDQRLPPGKHGMAEFVMQIRSDQQVPAPFEASLRTIRPSSGPWFSQPFAIPQPLGEWTKVPGRWVRMKPSITLDPAELLAEAEQAVRQSAGMIPHASDAWNKVGEAPLSLTGILMPEEVKYGHDGVGEGWLFIASRRDRRGKSTASIIRGFGISNDMFSRVPVSEALRERTILVAGCGAIGSFVALELARAGVGRLLLYDKDDLEPGNSVRWPLGRSYWGVPKVAALRAHLQRHFPWTRVDSYQGTIGGATADEAQLDGIEEHPLALIRRLIQQADVVIDTTASTECQHAMAWQCRSVGKPLIIGYATEGAAGGVVAQIRPAPDYCFVCLSKHWSDGDLPTPAVDSSGTVLPVGCAEPTFTGGAFDLQEVSLEVVRTAITTATTDAESRADWNLAVLSHLVDGKRTLPRWTGELLPPHPDCTCKGNL